MFPIASIRSLPLVLYARSSSTSMRDPPARQCRVFLHPHEKGSCEPPQTSMQDLHGILAGIVWKLMQGIHARPPNQTRLEALVALGALGCVVSVYVWSLNDAIKCSALDLSLASRTLGPHFRPHLLTVTAAKSNGWSRTVGWERSWHSARSEQPLWTHVLPYHSKYPYLTAGMSAYIERQMKESISSDKDLSSRVMR